MPIAQRLLTRQLEVFSARNTDGGDKYSFAWCAVENKQFFGEGIAESGGKNQEINRAQFYKTRCDSINARLLPDKEREISNAVEILNAANWATELSPAFGEQEVKFMCDKFRLSFSNLKHDFRDYKDSGGEQHAVNINLRQLFNCIATVPISTAGRLRTRFQQDEYHSCFLAHSVVTNKFSPLMFWLIDCFTAHQHRRLLVPRNVEIRYDHDS